jgi:DNA-binding HxlR family transcriptional regulator
MTATSPDPPHPDLPDADREAADAAVADLLALLGKRHTLSLLYLFARDPGPWRFGELEARLDLSPTTLSDRLAELTAEGFLDRTDREEVPPRVEYVATERAEALKPAFGHLYGWCRKYGQGVRH